jgi:predicted amidohydrolase YtcJ
MRIKTHTVRPAVVGIDNERILGNIGAPAMLPRLLPIALLALAACQSANDSEVVADTIYSNGKIYTVNDSQPWAEAVAIKDDTILFVGNDDEVRAHIGRNTNVYDLGGKMMLPAFQDGHIHPISSALDILNCSLYSDVTLQEYLQTLADCADAKPDAEWIRGAGWSVDVFGPGALANKKLLDDVVSDRPVYLESKDGHTGWVNSRALQVLGIDKQTPDPKDGIIDRDPITGEAIGSLQEDAVYLAYQAMPEPTVEDRIEGLRYARDLLHSIGITAIQTGYSDEKDLQAFRALDDRDDLGLRVVATQYWDANADEDQLPGMLDLKNRYTRGNLRPISVKIYQDGVMENFTAGMLEPYVRDDGGSGMEIFEPSVLNVDVTRLDAAGFQIHFHAIGDRAIRQCLDAVEAAQRINGELAHRHTIVHLQLIDSDDYARFGELDVVANFQPYWAVVDEYVSELTVPFIGEERTSRMYPIGSIVEAGGRVAFGSDWSVSSADPLLGIETAMTRLDPEGYDYPPLNLDQAITLEQAVRGYTLEAAYQLHHEDKTGSIEVGKLADLVVLDENLFAIEPAAINEAKVVLTLFGGRPVFGDPVQL